MTTANIMKFDSIIVEIVEDSQARLITLSIIRLCTSSTEIIFKSRLFFMTDMSLTLQYGTILHCCEIYQKAN